MSWKKSITLQKNNTMKKLIITGILLMFVAIILESSSCKTKSSPSPWPVYSYTDSIVNPPDTFQVVYNISQPGDRITPIVFGEDAVWLVEKLGDSRIYFYGFNGNDAIIVEISDTIAMKGGYVYTFIANNVQGLPDFNNFFTQFNKLNIDYTTYEPKF
jgi:hypothetical protein